MTEASAAEVTPMTLAEADNRYNAARAERRAAQSRYFDAKAAAEAAERKYREASRQEDRARRAVYRAMADELDREHPAL